MHPHDRYHRQTLLPWIGAQGQERLSSACAAIVGCGALGGTIAQLLARAGVGRLVLIDRDVVELTNLQRQALFTESDAAEGLPKAEAAAKALRTINSQITIDPVIADLTAANAEKILGLADGPRPGVILDGTDNFAVRYLLNDVAVKYSVPYVYGGVIGAVGMRMAILPGRGPCLRCLFPDPPQRGSQPTCDTAGVLGPAAWTIASHQAAEAMKILLGLAEHVDRALLEIDLFANTTRSLLVSPRRGDCPCCEQRRFEFLAGTMAGEAQRLCGRYAVQISSPHAAAINLAELANRLRPVGETTATASYVRTQLPSGAGGCELTIFADGRAIIRGTTDPRVARVLYDRYVGS